MVSVGEVSFWVKSPPASSHGGVHLVAVLRAVAKTVLLLSLFQGWDYSTTVRPFFHHSSPVSHKWPQRGISALTLGQAACSEGSRSIGLALAIAHARMGMENSCSSEESIYFILFTALGSRGKAEWLVRAEQKMPHVVKIYILIVSTPRVLWAFETVILLQCYFISYPWDHVLCCTEVVLECEIMMCFIRMQFVLLHTDLWIWKTCTK